MKNTVEESSKRRIRNAFVTGGAGFIGSHLVDALINRGIKVTSYDDYSAGKKSNLEIARKSDLLTEVVGDTTDKDALKKAMKDVDTVFNLAASKKTICLKNPHRDLEVNGGGALKLLEVSLEMGVEKFVHASTGSVYGEPCTFPQKESHPLRPNSYYGVSKLAGESYVRTFSHLYGLDTTVLRYFHVYGPRQESSDVGGVVSIFLRKALTGQPLTIHGDGNQIRTFTWVGDIVEANLRAATNTITKNKVYNCASGIQVSINELAKMVLSHTGVNGRIIFSDALPGDIVHFDVSNELITKELDITFNKNFESGLRLTLEWAINAFKSNIIE